MTEAEAQAMRLLQQISQKLDRLLEELPAGAGSTSTADKRSNSRLEIAEEIAAMTPASIRQTDSVELLHADR
jgi:hypothetical protein